MAYAGHLPELLELIGEVAYAMLEKTLDAIVNITCRKELR